MTKDIFIIGSRGLPARYGGFETFVEALVSHQVSDRIRYHVACLSQDEDGQHFSYAGADCFTIKVPQILGPAQVIAYDMKAIIYAIRYVKKHQIDKPIFYILGNTIGLFMKPFAHQIKKIGGDLYVNPDGLEWKRSKWSRPVQTYLKASEKMMSQVADKLICDNQGIEEYMHRSYPWSKTCFIAYGTPQYQEVSDTSLLLESFLKEHGVSEKGYYLIVGRFVPENNYRTMIEEFMTSRTTRDLVIICNHVGNSYFDTLKKETGFERDKRIKFVGTVYDQALLMAIRRSAFAYIHGHEVGGTNPGLLEALSHTDLNLVLDVSFNKKVAQHTALYWEKEKESLSALIDDVDKEESFKELGHQAKEHMRANYSWSKIISEYEDLFLNES